MKNYFKHGLAVIIPIALVYQVFIWIYNLSSNILKSVIGIDFEWYLPILSTLGLAVGIIILGVVFKHLRLVNWLKRNIEKNIINRIPIVKTVYNFGRDISDTFISDVKNDGDMTIVEVYMGPITMMGILTDVKNDLVFVVSAPSPVTGAVIRTKNYKILEGMTFMDLVKINTSLGRINGEKWS